MTMNKRFTVQRIYKGMTDGVKNYDWCVMKNDEIILRLTTRINCKDVVEVLNELSEENKQLKMGINSLKLLVQNWEALDEEKDGQLDRQNQALKKLKKENEQLKSLNQELRNELSFDEKMYTTFKEIIDEADDLITSHLSKHYQRRWKNFCKHRGVLDD